MPSYREVEVLPVALWERLAPFELFKHFTTAQRDAFLSACEHDRDLRVCRFDAGETVCRKGQYELDLCLVLQGAVAALDEDKVPSATYRAGEVYGEMGAMGGLPRSCDMVAAAPAEILYVPRHALKLLEINPPARALLAERYRREAVRDLTGQSKLFAGVSAGFIDELVARAELIRYDLRGVPLVIQGEVGDALYLVREGFVQVVHERDDGSKRVLAYLRTGEYFGEMALVAGSSGRRQASVLTAGKCELVKISKTEFVAACERYPEVLDEVSATIARRHQEEAGITPEISALLERSGQLGLIQSEALLVMDLTLCIKCDLCVKACESLHGRSRLVRTGITLDKYLIPSACRHCDDPKCMNSCPTGAIKRRPEGEIYFDYDLCTGCGNCAIACPYDNIAMIETPRFDRAQARKARAAKEEFFRPYPVAGDNTAAGGRWQRWFGGGRRPQPQAPAARANAHVPPAYPIKCDLCDGLPFMGCVHNCPTGAAMRIDPAELFQRTGAVSVGSTIRKATGGSD